jgi:hypothetical protein
MRWWGAALISNGDMLRKSQGVFAPFAERDREKLISLQNSGGSRVLRDLRCGFRATVWTGVERIYRVLCGK